MAANETWYFTVSLTVESNGTADFKFAFTYPTGGSGRWSCVGPKLNVSDALAQCEHGTASGDSISVGGAAGGNFLTIIGVVVNGSTAGNLQLQWAQATASAVDTKVLINSYLTAWRQQ